MIKQGAQKWLRNPSRFRITSQKKTQFTSNNKCKINFQRSIYSYRILIEASQKFKLNWKTQIRFYFMVHRVFFSECYLPYNSTYKTHQPIQMPERFEKKWLPRFFQKPFLNKRQSYKNRLLMRLISAYFPKLSYVNLILPRLEIQKNQSSYLLIFMIPNILRMRLFNRFLL